MCFFRVPNDTTQQDQDHPHPPCYLIDQAKKHILRLLVNVSQAAAQFSTQLQTSIKAPIVFSDVPQMPLAPYASGRFLAFRHRKVWKEVITLFVICATYLLKNRLFHLAVLRYIEFPHDPITFG